ncbi:MAG TPA: YciI family protein [Bryobacteraceae bacterium]|nr:YciI family protein [Bryobacteraceae bacterium]
MPQYMLLLYSDPSGWDRLSPEEMQKALEKYIAWGQKAFVKGSMRLAHDVGRVLRAKGGTPRATDGPYSETKEVLGGYYLIEAADYDEAVKRTLDHPQLEYGGTIEVRQTFGM